MHRRHSTIYARNELALILTGTKRNHVRDAGTCACTASARALPATIVCAWTCGRPALRLGFQISISRERSPGGPRVGHLSRSCAHALDYGRTPTDVLSTAPAARRRRDASHVSPCSAVRIIYKYILTRKVHTRPDCGDTPGRVQLGCCTVAGSRYPRTTTSAILYGI